VDSFVAVFLSPMLLHLQDVGALFIIRHRGGVSGVSGNPFWAGFYIPEDYSLSYSASRYTLILIFLTQKQLKDT